MDCTKVRYQDELGAKLALLRLSLKPSEREERRAYRCPDCKGWHLTKRGKRS